jgi:type VI secretion system secreted protein VgrG
MQRALNAHTPLGDAWWAISLDGTETLSSLYEFQLGLKSDNPDIDGQALIGEIAAVELEAQNGTRRYFSGQIVKVSSLGKSGRHWAYTATIAPKLWHASRRTDFKIWQNLTVKEITSEVLDKNAIRYEWRLKSSYKTWEYLVQYGETDLIFLTRLFEHEGIYYWFEHGEGGETLILGDHFSTHETVAAYERIPFYPPDATRADEEHYYSWSGAREAESGRYAHRDYDFKKPSKDLATEFSDPRGHLFDQYEIYAYPGSYIESGDGQAYATVRLEALQSAQDTLVLEGFVRGAIPGARFSLYNHPRDDQNRDLLITRAAYKIVDNDYEGGGSGGGGNTEGGHEFQVQIEVIPADRQFRSALKTLKPRTLGPETAVVVGPAGSEIHTDQYGRVKVHFHWDRYGKKDGNDSCWIRVAYPWAGTNYGSIHIPRVGQEVIVDFERGDPDHPLITGRVYNAEQMPPWDLPANKTQSGILTRSSLQGTPDNANALRFEDAKGEEQVWLHAERNQDIEVENNETHWVGQDRTKTIDRDETTTVHRNRTETVDGNETITIHKNRREEVDRDEKITIHKNRTKTVDRNETVLIGLTKTETVGVANLDTVGVARMTNIGAVYSQNVGVWTGTMVGEGSSLKVGKTYEAGVGDTMKLKVGKRKEESVGNSSVQQAGKYLSLTCGKAQIVLTEEGGIYLQGAHIELTGESAINGDAGLVQWNAGAAQSAPGDPGTAAKAKKPEDVEHMAEQEDALETGETEERKERAHVEGEEWSGAAFELAKGGALAAGAAGVVKAVSDAAAGGAGSALGKAADLAAAASGGELPSVPTAVAGKVEEVVEAFEDLPEDVKKVADDFDVMKVNDVVGELAGVQDFADALKSAEM